MPGISSRHDAARDLTRYAIVDRYPGAGATVSQALARRHVELARTVLDAVSAELRAYLEAGPPAS